jgi:hypothetical protein
MVVMSLTIEKAFMSQDTGYQYAIFQTKLISFFLPVVSLNFLYEVSSNTLHLAPKSPEGLPRRDASAITCFKLNQNGAECNRRCDLGQFSYY